MGLALRTRFLVLAGAVALCSQSLALTWSMREVTLTGNTNIEITGINNAGQLCATSNNHQRGLRINVNGQVDSVDLRANGYLGGFAGGINENGEVAFWGPPVSNSGRSRVSYWAPGNNLVNLTAPDFTTLFEIQCFGINNARSAVGWARYAGPGSSVPTGIATYYSPAAGGALVPGEGDGYNLARDIDEAGNIVGCVNLNPIMWRPDGSYLSLAQPNSFGSACSINSGGLISGTLNDTAGKHLAIWNTSGQLLHKIYIGDKDTTPNPLSEQTYMNENGEVVVSVLRNGALRHCFWSQSTGLLDITNSVTNMNSARLNLIGINNRREIIARGYVGSVYKNNLLLTPVPEPSELIVLGVGLVGIALRRRKKLSEKGRA